MVQHVLEANFGTPIGYADPEGQLHSNPPPHARVTAVALFVLVDETQRPTAAVLQKLIDGLALHTRA